jgi:hypothetical protein
MLQLILQADKKAQKRAGTLQKKTEMIRGFFSLPETEIVIQSKRFNDVNGGRVDSRVDYKCNIGIKSGKLYITPNNACWYCKLPTTQVSVRDAME